MARDRSAANSCRPSERHLARQRREHDHAERHADDPDRDLEEGERDVERGDRSGPERRGDGSDDDEGDLGRPEADRPGRHQRERHARLRVGEIDVWRVSEPEAKDRGQLHEQMAERACDDADGEAGHTH